MRKIAVLLLLASGIAAGSYQVVKSMQAHQAENTVLRVTMNLSAFGVESDDYPSITATLDFEQHTGHCVRTYYNPAYPNSSYELTANELSQIQQLLQRADLKKLKPSYTTTRTDQPSSITVIQTRTHTFTIKDYGLDGDYPLSELYDLVYKLEY